jgi:hypothetical protein
MEPDWETSSHLCDKCFLHTDMHRNQGNAYVTLGVAQRSGSAFNETEREDSSLSATYEKAIFLPKGRAAWSRSTGAPPRRKEGMLRAKPSLRQDTSHS